MKLCVERQMRLIMGSFILISLALAYFWSPYWLLWTALVGVNLIQSAFTGYCPLKSTLAKFGEKK